MQLRLTLKCCNVFSELQPERLCKGTGTPGIGRLTDVQLHVYNLSDECVYCQVYGQLLNVSDFLLLLRRNRRSFSPQICSSSTSGMFPSDTVGVNRL